MQNPRAFCFPVGSFTDWTALATLVNSFASAFAAHKPSICDQIIAQVDMANCVDYLLAICPCGRLARYQAAMSRFNSNGIYLTFEVVKYTSVTITSVFNSAFRLRLAQFIGLKVRNFGNFAVCRKTDCQSGGTG